jgi:hypothetical protein
MIAPSTSSVDLFVHKFYRHVVTKKASEISHLLLNGGKLKIPEELENEFLEAISSDILNGRPAFVVEKKTQIFKLHFDLDMKRDIKQSELEMIHSTVSAYFSNEDTTMIVCTTNNGHGIHVIFPKLLVEEDQCLWTRAGTVAALRQQDRLADWNTIVDVVVCTHANGIRLIGCDKVKICEKMQRKS